MFSERSDTLWIDPDLSPENVQSNLERQARTTTEGGAQSAERRSELEALFGTAHSDVTDPPTRSLALSAYPNRFVESTRVSYELPSDARVDIRIFDVLGREVVAFFEDRQAAGTHELIWDRRDGFGHRAASGLCDSPACWGKGPLGHRVGSALSRVQCQFLLFRPVLTMIPTWYLVLGTWYLVLGTWSSLVTSGCLHNESDGSNSWGMGQVT